MRSVPAVLAVFLGLTQSNSVGAQDRSSEPPAVRQLTAKVFTIDPPSAGGGTITVLVGATGLLLVDASFWVDPQPVLEILAMISDKPVRYVVNTHCHRDHTAGNAAFQAAGATIVAHTNIRRRVQAQKCDGEVALPTLSFDTELTLHFDTEEVRLVALPAGHTDGDVLVHFKNAKVLATGDAFLSSALPFPSRYAGGNMLGVNEQLRTIVALFPDDVTIVPGHGPLAAMSDVRRALDTLDQVRDVVAQRVAEGRTMDQLATMNLLEPWQDVLGEDGPQYLGWYYDFLTGPPDPRYQL